MDNYFVRKVRQGTGKGRGLGFPTVNLNAGLFADRFRPGVYACHVRAGGKTYAGALFFGRKINVPQPSLEIYILGFRGDLYGQYVSFRPDRRLRNVKKFESFDSLKKQIQKDVDKVRALQY